MGCSSLVSFVGYLRGMCKSYGIIRRSSSHKGEGVIKPRESFSISSSVEVLNANAS